MNREIEKRMAGMAAALGAEAEIVKRGRHARAMRITVRGKVVTLPIAGHTGNGRSRHTDNALAQLRRIVRMAQVD